MAASDHHEGLRVSDEAPLPPKGFDPLRADADTLEQYWLPARPNPKLQPVLSRHWIEMMSPTPTFVPASSRQPAQALIRSTTTSPAFKARGGGRLEFSRNWSGACVTALRANRFRRVVGRWRAPALEPGLRTAEDQSEPFRCSIWIGFDGRKRWTQSMPQVGSVHTLGNDGQESHGLWWQWWERNSAATADNLPWTISGVPVSRGDVILCSLSIRKTDPTAVRLHVVNRTTHRFATVQISKEPVLGSTAEWIVERPADWQAATQQNPSGPLFPLPDFGEVAISRCAVEHASPDAPAFLPRVIDLKQRFLPSDRVAVISAASILHEPPAQVRVSYRRPF